LFKRYLCWSLSFHLLLILGVGFCLPSSTPGIEKSIVLKFSLAQPQTRSGGFREEDSTDFRREKYPLRVMEDRIEELGEEYADDRENRAEESNIPIEARDSSTTAINTWEQRAKEEEATGNVEEAEAEPPEPLPQSQETLHVGKEGTEVRTSLKEDSVGAQTQHNSEKTEQRVPGSKSKTKKGHAESSRNELDLGADRGANLDLEGKKSPDQLPVLVNRKEPFYPLLARRRGWAGTVTLEVSLERDGRITEVDMVESSGYELLDKEAVKAISGWVYEPAYHQGIPIKYRLRVKITFDLEDEAAQK